jgi:hypothetical protein
MSDVPDVTWQEIAVDAQHRVSLEATFRRQKAVSKLLNDAFYDALYREIKAVAPVRPGIMREPLRK